MATYFMMLALAAPWAAKGGFLVSRKELMSNATNATELVTSPEEIMGMKALDDNMVQNGGLKEGHSNQLPELTMVMNTLASKPGVKTICETGFNGGHSALRWVLHSQAHVYSFDLGQHAYAAPAAQWIQAKYPGRHTATWGDSTVTLPKFAAEHPDVKCDLIFVDGGHSEMVANLDMKNFKVLAAPHTNVVMIDDVYCSSSWCQGPTSAWRTYVTSGVVKETSYKVMMQNTRGWAVGTYA